jgi:hypothetical protein
LLTTVKRISDDYLIREEILADVDKILVLSQKEEVSANSMAFIKA